MNRDYLLPAFGIAFMVIALAVLIGVCAKAPIADQQVLSTRTPTVEPTYTPAATVTAYVLVATPIQPTPIPIPTLIPTSTLTPLPTVTATQERPASEFNTPAPTSTLRPPFDPHGAPAQVPAQVPRSNP